jgi:tetratricopeptide (TPR) repeat protein
LLWDQRGKGFVRTVKSMRRLVFVVSLLCMGGWCASVARAASLAPSADPVTNFITVADSVARTQGDEGLAAFVADNAALVGASVAKLVDVAYQVAQGGDAAAAAENVAFAKKVAAAHEARGGSKVARGIVDTYEKWTPAQRKSRARAMALEEEAAAARKAGDISKAVSLLDQARAIYQKIGDAHSVAVNWGTRAVANSSTGDWSLVLADYEKALPARRAVEDRILEGRTLNGFGSAYQQLGDYPRSIDYYRQAIALREKTGDLGGLGTSYAFLGHVYSRTGRYAPARDCYEKALPILESVGGPQQMVEILSGIALVNADMGRTRDADDAYRRAIEIAAAGGLPVPEGTMRRSFAEHLRQQARYGEALAQLDAAVKIFAAHPDPVEEALVFSTRGYTYANMGEMDDARANLLEFAERTKSLDSPSHAALAQRNIAELYGELGAYDRALKAIDEAIALAEKAGDARGYRDAQVARAEFLSRSGRYPDALAAWQEALAQDAHDQAEIWIVEDEIGIASIDAMMGKTREARERLRAVTPRARRECRVSRWPLCSRWATASRTRTPTAPRPTTTAGYAFSKRRAPASAAPRCSRDSCPGCAATTMKKWRAITRARSSPRRTCVGRSALSPRSRCRRRAVCSICCIRRWRIDRRPRRTNCSIVCIRSIPVPRAMRPSAKRSSAATSKRARHASS